jgi:UPF0716 protein FxsA
MPFLVILFIVVPIVELYLIIQVGQAIGVVPTLVLLLADALLGSLLLRQQGRGAWRRFNAALAERRFPGREVADGLMIAVGGTLLLTPGFLTDIFGLALLIPPSRAVIRRLLRRFAARRFVVMDIGSRVPRYNGTADHSYDFDGSAEEIDADDPRLSGGPPTTPPGS